MSVNAEDRPHGAGEVGILKTSALNGGVFQPVQNKAVLASERSRVAEPVSADSILFSRMNTPALVGESCYVAESWPTLFVPDRIWQLKPKDRDTVSMVWLSYVLRSTAARVHIETHASGTSGSMKNLPKSKLLDLEVLYPPVREQRSIAAVLSALDTTIRQTESIIEKLKQVKQGLLHDLLTRGIDDNGELRQPPNEAPYLYRQSPLGWMPRSWATSRIEHACTEVVDCPHSTPTFQDDGVLVARTMNIKAGTFLHHLASRVSEAEYFARIARLRPEAGDVIFTREAPVGEAFVVPQGMRICLGQRVMLLRPHADKLLGHFLISQIYSGAVAERISSLTSGTTNPHLNVSEVRQFLIPLPPLTEQKAIATQLLGIEYRMQSERDCRNKLATLKSGLMDDLLTGRVRVTPLLEAIASRP